MYVSISCSLQFNIICTVCIFTMLFSRPIWEGGEGRGSGGGCTKLQNIVGPKMSFFSVKSRSLNVVYIKMNLLASWCDAHDCT